MNLEETRIPVAGNFRCRLASVATEYEGKEVAVGDTSECKHCKAKFVLAEDKNWREVEE